MLQCQKKSDIILICNKVVLLRYLDSCQQIGGTASPEINICTAVENSCNSFAYQENTARIICITKCSIWRVCKIDSNLFYERHFFNKSNKVDFDLNKKRYEIRAILQNISTPKAVFMIRTANIQQNLFSKISWSQMTPRVKSNYKPSALCIMLDILFMTIIPTPAPSMMWIVLNVIATVDLSGLI